MHDRPSPLPRRATLVALTFVALAFAPLLEAQSAESTTEAPLPDDTVNESPIEPPTPASETSATEHGSAAIEAGAVLDAPVPSAASAPSAGVPRAASTAVELGDDATWQLYHDAAMAIAMGERERARELLRRVATSVDHPASPPARRLLERLEALERGRPGPFANERPSGLARGELVAWHTIGGASVGTLICGLARCDDARVWGVSILGLGLASGGLALGLSRDGVRPGSAALHGAALRWGYLDTWLLSSVLGLTWRERNDPYYGDDLEGTDGHLVALLIGHGLGLGGALLADHFFAPSAGDVGLMDSLHTLSAASITFLLGALDGFEFDSLGDVRRALFPLLLGNAVALGLGGYLTTKVEMTRGRAFLLDLGMILGAGLGVGLPLLFAGDDVEPEMLFGGGAAGVGLGFAVAWLATRRLGGSDDEASRVQLAAAPMPGGAQASLHVRLR